MGPKLSTDEELSPYQPEDRDLIRRIEAETVERFRHYLEDYDHTERNEAGYVTHYDKQGRIMDSGPIHTFFSLSYASWLTLPRVALQEMPLDWQAKFVALLEEGFDRGLAGVDGLIVTRKVGNRFVRNEHWNNYRRGNTVEAKAVDAANGWTDDDGW